MEEFRNLKRVAINELRKLDSQYANKEEFSDADLKTYDCLMHGLKSQLTAEAMMGAEQGGYSETGMSERRGRGMNGQYVSRDGSYGGSMGYGYCEHYPPMMPYDPYPGRRW